MKNVFKLKYLMSTIARVLAIVFQFLLILLITRVMGDEATGIYASSFSLASIFAIVLTIGQTAAILREIPSMFQNGKGACASKIVSRGIQLTIYACLLTSIPLTLIAVYFTGSLFFGIVTFLIGSGIAFLNLISAVARAYGSVFLSETNKNVVWRVFACVFVMLSLFKFEQSIELFLAALVFILYSSVVFSTVILISKRNINVEYMFLGELLENINVDFQNWYIQTLQVILANLDVVVVGAVLGFKEAGIYFILMRIASLVALPLSITNPVIMPVISRLAKRDFGARASRAVLKNTVINTSASLFLALLVMSASAYVFVQLSGQSITHEVQVALLIVVFSQVVNSVVGPSFFATQMFNVQKETAWVLSILVVVFPFLVAVMGQAMGVVGVAIAAALIKALVHLSIFLIIRVKSSFNLLNGKYSR